MTQETEILRQWIAEARNIVFFGGAGVSTASGIPDFRSAHQGIYNTPGGRSYEEMLSHEYFVTHPDEFWDFYRRVMLYPDAKPNAAHLALAELERRGKCKAVVTQNIDGLHQAAGSEKVLELHGSVHRNYCTRCGKFYDLDTMLHTEGIPRCSCGGMIKPDVVLYEEALDYGTMQRAIARIAAAEMLIIGGTSLVVYPAAGFIDYFRGKHLVVINKSETAKQVGAELTISAPIGEIMGRIRV